MISKKLAIEILGFGIQEIKVSANSKNLLYTNYEEPRMQDWKYINIHELAHKCKEWANKYSLPVEVVDKQVKLYSYVDRFGGHCRIKLFPAQTDRTDMSFHEDTEPEAIFKACEWVREHKAQA